MQKKFTLLFNSTLVLLFSSLSWAQLTIKADHVQVTLIPINTNQVGVHYKLDPEWHIYWKNPGDSGAAPKFELKGATLKNIHWPYPHRLPVLDLTNYGYENDVLIPLDIVPDTKATEITFDLEWLVCKVECIPGFAVFKIQLNEIAANEADVALYNKFRELVPKSNKNWQSELVSTNSTGFTFKLLNSEQSTLSNIQNLYVFPENGVRFKTQNPRINVESSGYEITVPLSVNASTTPSGNSDAFTVVVNYKDGKTEFFTTEVKNQIPFSTLAYGMLFAFLGGLILNLMPCVFPVLSLKAMSFLNDNEKNIRKSAWAYTAGVLVTFVAVGGALTLLRLSGQSIGWGFQLQSAWLVYLLALLFFTMALNFWGFFEVGNSVANSANQIGLSRFFSGSFGTGVLAVIVASPCTAPFMGSALGLTLLLPPHLSLLIFISLGFGMALPMILISYFPKFIGLLPRSGAWMENVKKFMTFPMLVTCLWLVWVLEQQKGSDSVFVVLLSFLSVTLFIWLISISKQKLSKFLFTALLIASCVYTLKFVIETVRTSASVSADNPWHPFDAALIEQKRESQAVFVDFTASWCITCQVNKKNVLNTDEIQKLFKEKNVFLVQADWTSQDSKITQALAEFGRNSVPLYVFYEKKNKPVLLSEILTKQMIINLFNKGE